MAVKTPASSTPTQPPLKRQRTFPLSSSSAAQSPKGALRAIKNLESDLSKSLASSSSLNALVDLQAIASSASEPEVVSKAIYALYRVYTQVATKGLLEKLKSGEGTDDREVNERNLVRSWLITNISSFGDFLGGLLKDEESHLRISAIQILFAILKLLSTNKHPSSSPYDSTNVEATPPRPSTSFDSPFFYKTVLALLTCPPSSRKTDDNESESHNVLVDIDVRDTFVRTWLNKYADVRWYFLREVISILSISALLTSHPHIPENALSILEKLEGMPTKESEIDTFWLEGFAAKQSKSSKSSKSKSSASESDSDSDVNEEEDDWRTFFDDPQPSSSQTQTQTKKKRIHKMSVAEQIRSLASHRAVFTRCWLTLLPLLSNPSSLGSVHTKADNEKKSAKGRKGEKTALMTEPDALSLTTRALTVLHRGVMPHLTRAILVMDWVAGCVDQGSVVGMLALNALFILMRDYNLDYPQFYTRLYAFLDRDVLHAKHRARFFRLLELFLSSTHLPVTLLASFLKRLARLSLSAPPAAIVLIIPFTYNILKRHPALMVMIHNPNPSEDIDPYLADAPNPQQTRALESSLWELYTHSKHYHHAVSVLARVFEGAFTKPAYGMEDFLDHGYASLFESESSRKIKPNMSVPVIEPEVSKLRKLVIRRKEEDEDEEGDVSVVEGIDIVSSLWRF